MKTISLYAALALFAASGAAHAEMQEHHHDMAQHQMAMSKDASTQHQGVGVIKAVNEKAHKVQIAHEAIPSLKWPPMTMWFGLQGELPHEIKAGESVKFDLQQLDGKKWSITHIEKQ
ncbi:MAG: copper-binding protein [Gallionella sp.]|nr:copper-binding protein [Gallionella sp.]